MIGADEPSQLTGLFFVNTGDRGRFQSDDAAIGRNRGRLNQRSARFPWTLFREGVFSEEGKSSY